MFDYCHFRFISKQDVFDKAMKYWNPDKTRFWQSMGVDLVIDRGEGYCLYDMSGRRLIDLHLNGSTYNFGHRHPELVETLKGALDHFDIGNHCVRLQRSRDPGVLEWAESEFKRLLEVSTRRAKTTGEILEAEHRRAGLFDKGLIELVEKISSEQGLQTMRLDTVAAHDGIRMTKVCPAIVVAIKSVGGICHNATEYSEPRDI